MANYLFEQMTDAQALAYVPEDDSLFFLTGSPSTLGVTYNPAAGLSNASITLTMGSVSHTFVAAALAGESFTFFSQTSDQGTVQIGFDTAETDTVDGVEGAGSRYYALGGNDSITGSEASDTIWGGTGNDTIVSASAPADDDGNVNDADYLNGGAGSDSIFGSDGNEHIWGNESTSVAGSADGADYIDAGAGKDYVNGNAGNDIIYGGDDNDRLYGGAGDDSVDGGDGLDYIQGNKGDDYLLGFDGDDTIRGGADDDFLNGGADNDVLMGDAGDDFLVGGDGYDVLTGGAGEDVFAFSYNGPNESSIDGIPDGETDVITDFTQGDDIIALGFTVDAILLNPTVVNDLQTAFFAANGLLSTTDSDGPEVAAIQVGADTYLFYDADGGTGNADSVIKLTGITAADLETDDFDYAV
jgi:serralysin